MSIYIRTEKPVAFDSPDHLVPHGTERDNSVNWEFNRRLFLLIPAPQIRVLDLGCSGGGFVKSILDQGGFAVGVEGSDFSKKRERAEWATIPDHLFTADVTVPFTIGDETQAPLPFNVITAWEFMEHIAEDKLGAVFENIRRHSAPGALTIVSVSSETYVWEGVQYHQTVRPAEWWLDQVTAMGFAHRQDLVEHFGIYWVRGWPQEPSFHLVLTDTLAQRRSFAVSPGGGSLEDLAARASALSEQGDDVKRLLDEGEALFSRGDTARAEALFRQAHAIAPGSVRALNNLGVLAFSAGDIDSAACRFSEVLAQDPTHASALENMARCCEARQDHQQAAEWFACAAGQSPENVALWNALGAACVRCGKLAAAHQAFAESYHRDPAQESVAAILREIESLLNPVTAPAVAG